ncbi:MAG: HlyD family efflux transporter periplasmic adaptor subunit [Acidobacteria bacterium]|nr:MAG: HlyD family efflux transporter periplasmic adaptor subunit [Acidobacteriota bacterium]
MKFKNAALILIILALGVTGFYMKNRAVTFVSAYFKPSTDDPIPTVRAMAKAYTLQVGAGGELTGLEMKQVQAPRIPRGSLKIAWIEKEGTIVPAGVPIVRFDNSDALLNLQQNQNTVATYESRISKSREDGRSQEEVFRIDRNAAELDLNFSERQIREDEEIFSRWEIEESIMSAALAKYKKGNIERKSTLNRTLSDADLKILGIESQKAAAEVKLAQQTLSSLEVASPVAGVVLYKRIGWGQMVGVGTEVWPGMPLLEIADLDKFQGKLNVLESDIAGIEPGKKVRVDLHSFPGYQVTGTVTKVATAAQQFNRDDPRKYFVCDVVLDVPLDMMQRLKPGMKIRGEIQIASRENSIVQPKSALIKKGSEFIVFVKKDDKYVERKVRIVDGDYAFYLVEGVKGGEEVCLQHPFEKQKLRLPDFSAPSPATQGRRFTVVFG